MLRYFMLISRFVLWGTSPRHLRLCFGKWGPWILVFDIDINHIFCRYHDDRMINYDTSGGVNVSDMLDKWQILWPKYQNIVTTIVTKTVAGDSVPPCIAVNAFLVDDRHRLLEALRQISLLSKSGGLSQKISIISWSKISSITWS